MCTGRGRSKVIYTSIRVEFNNTDEMMEFYKLLSLKKINVYAFHPYIFEKNFKNKTI